MKRLAPVLLALSILGALPAGARAAAGWYPAGGVTWARPMDPGVRELYPGGPGFFAAMGYAWPERLRVEIRMDWFRQSGHPEARLATSADSRLTLTPVSLEAHGRIGHGPLRPYASAGAALVFSEERFTYAMFETRSSVTGKRTDVAGLLGLGLETRREGLTVRFGLRSLLTTGHRRVVRATGRTDESTGDRAHPSLFTAGLEFQVR